MALVVAAPVAARAMAAAGLAPLASAAPNDGLPTTARPPAKLSPNRCAGVAGPERALDELSCVMACVAAAAAFAGDAPVASARFAAAS